MNVALRKSGHSKHDDIRFVKDNEIDTWIQEIPNDRQIHVQVTKKGDSLELYAHTEPSINVDPVGHVVSAAFEENISFGAGARKLRADLKKAGLKFK